jgi:peptide/nickel transport system substrate-binding protein
MSPRIGKRLVNPWAVVLALALAAPALVACNENSTDEKDSASTDKGRTGGELVWGKPDELDTWDPITGGLTQSAEIQQLVYDRLVDVNGVEVEPQLAESWEQTSPTTYEFTLRKGAKFSNGRALTAADVVGSLKRASGPKALVWGARLGIADAEATGDGKVKVTLDGRRTDFLAALANAAASILPMKELRAGTFDPSKEMLGSGPFKVMDHKKDESWTFVRNPHHWDKESPRVDKLTVRIMTDDAARIAGLRDGSIDVTTFETPDALRLLDGQANVETVVQKTTDFYRLDLNAKTSMFRDKRLRDAVSLALDRKKIAEVVFGGASEPSAVIAPAFGDICDPEALPFGEPDLERARQLVDAAGARGKSLVINVYNTIVPMSNPIAQVIQGDLEAIGFKVGIESLEAGEVFTKVFGDVADFDLTVGKNAGYPDPAMGLRNWNPEVSGWNRSYLLPDEELNQLIDRSNQTPPGDARTEDIRAACERIAQNANMIALVTSEPIVAYRSDKVDPDIQEMEPYGMHLRYLAKFGVDGPTTAE